MCFLQKSTQFLVIYSLYMHECIMHNSAHNLYMHKMHLNYLVLKGLLQRRDINRPHDGSRMKCHSFINFLLQEEMFKENQCFG